MIRYIEGVVAHDAPGGIVIVTNGIGYHIRTLKRLITLPGETLALYTYLAVRETALDLYGFTSMTELELFELLLTIPKIGPKSALQILDQADVSIIIESIQNQDPEHLTKLSSVSKKTAEKIIVTLKDKIELFSVKNPVAISRDDTPYQDAFDTLITLGYNPVHIKKALDKMKPTDTTSFMVKTALQTLN